MSVYHVVNCWICTKLQYCWDGCCELPSWGRANASQTDWGQDSDWDTPEYVIFLFWRHFVVHLLQCFRLLSSCIITSYNKLQFVDKMNENVLIILVIMIFSYTVNASLFVCYLLNYFVFFISNTHRNLRDTWNEMKATMWRNINYVSSSLYFYGNSAWCCILMCILMSIFLNVSHACCPWMSRTMIIRLRDSAVNL